MGIPCSIRIGSRWSCHELVKLQRRGGGGYLLGYCAGMSLGVEQELRHVFLVDW